MISESTVSVSTGLTRSLQEYRNILDNRQPQDGNRGESSVSGIAPSEDPVQITPYPLPEQPQEIVPPGEPLDTSRLEEAAQERRDTARKAAVFTFEQQQPQKLLDIYMQNSTEDSADSTSTAVDPGSVYRESMEYLRRDDLLAAFEKAGKPPEGEEGRLRIVV